MPFTDYVHFNKSLCMCCLTQNSPLYNLNYCKHLDFFDSCQIKDTLSGSNKITLDFEKPMEFNQLGKMVCLKCHSTLKKFAHFKKMVIENMKSLIGHEEGHTTDLIINKAYDLQIENVIQINISPLNETEECNNTNNNIHCQVVSKTDNITTNENVSKKLDNIQTALSIINRNQNFFNVKPQIFEQIRNVVLGSDILSNTMNDYSSIKNENLNNLCRVDTHGINKDGGISATQNKSNEDNLINNEFRKETLRNNEKVYRTEEKLNDDMANIATIHLSIEELNAERLRQEQCIQYQKSEYKCEGCIIGFSYEENMRDHIKRRHTPDTGTVKCDICSQVYQENNRETHIARHFTRYECNKCSKRFAILDEARRHFILQHKERKYHCLLCTFKTSSIKMFTRHRARKCSETKTNKRRRKNKLKTHSS